MKNILFWFIVLTNIFGCTIKERVIVEKTSYNKMCVEPKMAQMPFDITEQELQIARGFLEKGCPKDLTFILKETISKSNLEKEMKEKIINMIDFQCHIKIRQNAFKVQQYFVYTSIILAKYVEDSDAYIFCLKRGEVNEEENHE
jgi:hypothetical protein